MCGTILFVDVKDRLLFQGADVRMLVVVRGISFRPSCKIDFFYLTFDLFINSLFLPSNSTTLCIFLLEMDN